MTHHCARLIVVAIATVSFSTPITAQQEPTSQEVADIRVRAEQGEAEAQYQLGKMYEVGRGIAVNLAEAVAWYRRAADQGDMRAQYELGSRYRFGDGNIPQDFAQARVWIRRAADQGHPRAQAVLGYMYKNGEGVPQDLAQSETLYRQAVEGFRSAAEQGDAAAQSTLGDLYLYGDRFGDAVPRDYAQAVAWYRRAAVSFRQAAEQGDAEAQYDLGRLIDDTETRASIGSPNLWSGANPADSSSCDYCPLLESWAFAWYLSAAKQGHAEAQNNVAYMYYAGEGVREDRAAAEAWYRRAAEQEHVFSQNSLAALYERGDGIPQDDAEAGSCGTAGRLSRAVCARRRILRRCMQRAEGFHLRNLNSFARTLPKFSSSLLSSPTSKRFGLRMTGEALDQFHPERRTMHSNAGHRFLPVPESCW